MNRILIMLMVVLCLSAYSEEESEFLQIHGYVDTGVYISDSDNDTLIDQNIDLTVNVGGPVSLFTTGLIEYEQAFNMLFFKSLNADLGLVIETTENILVGYSFNYTKQSHRLFVRGEF